MSPYIEKIIEKPKSQFHQKGFSIVEGNIQILKLYEIIKKICGDRIELESNVIEKEKIIDIKQYDKEKYELRTEEELESIGYIRYNYGQIELRLKIDNKKDYNKLNRLI